MRMRTWLAGYLWGSLAGLGYLLIDAVVAILVTVTSAIIGVGFHTYVR